MIIKHKDAIKKTTASTCTVWEYNFDQKQLDIAVAKIDGRYPEGNKKVVNTVCDSIYYVISGNGMVHQETGDFYVEKGDNVFLEKNKWYWVEGKNLCVVIASSPAWFVDQYREIE